MAKKLKPELRAMLLAAREGDHSAARATLKLYGFATLAAEVKPGLPFSNRVRVQIDALTGAIGTEWEQDMLFDPPPPHRRPRNIVFED